MRKDEEYAKDLMVDRLSQDHTVTVEKGKEPPDYFFIVDGIKYAVDVTWLVQSRIIKGRKVSRRGEETGFSRWLSTMLGSVSGLAYAIPKTSQRGSVPQRVNILKR